MAINHPLNKNYSLKSIKIGASGVAPLDKLPQARLQALLSKEATFGQVWGMTETSCIATRFPYPEHDITGSVGRPLPNLDLKLVDDNGKDISGYNVRGELCVRGPTVVRGYFENPEANARDWDEDNFFHTGDIAYIEEGTDRWYIVDRKKVRSHLLQSVKMHVTNNPAGTHQSPRIPSRPSRTRRRSTRSSRHRRRGRDRRTRSSKPRWFRGSTSLCCSTAR